MIKTFGHVVGLAGVDLRLYAGEVLAVIGDNGAGKSTLIKCLSGAMIPDAGEMLVDGRVVSFKSTQEAREAGIETVYQTLAVAPALDIASNLFLAREVRKPGPRSIFRLTAGRCDGTPKTRSTRLPPCRTSARPWRRCPAASGRRSRSRAAAFGGKVVILDEPTAALAARRAGAPAGQGTARARAGHHPDQPQMPNARSRRPHPHPTSGRGAGVITPKSTPQRRRSPS
jgi:fructose transport system ATP-binding protein